MNELIKQRFPADDAAKLTKQLQEMNTIFEPYFFNLSNDDRKGMRTMAEGREGYVRLINEIAFAHADDLSRKDDPSQLDDKLQYDVQLEKMRQQAVTLVEKITETQLANSKDIMVMTDAFNDMLQTARKRSSALDQSLSAVDDFNKKFAPPNQDDTPPAA